MDRAGKSVVLPLSETELESEDSAGKEAVVVASPVLLPEFVAEESDEAPDDAADVAVVDDAVGSATLPVLERVGRSD